MLTFKRFFSIMFCSSIFLFLTIYFQLNLFIALNSLKVKDPNKQDIVLIWWTPFSIGERLLQCGEFSCLISDDRKLPVEHISAYLFYGTHFNKKDLPLPRGKNIWGLLHEESPRNSPLLNFESVLGLFNFSSTFSQFSDLPLTFQYLPSLESLVGLEFYKTFDQKSNSGMAPAIYIQSDCVTPNNRDSYVNELMQYIKVDSYGTCLNNKDLPDNLKGGVDSMMSPDLLNIIGNYKFAISFENALCDDYITEKLWRSLIVGAIPVYSGSPSVKDWLPNNNSAILIQDFDSPRALASFLNFLVKNSTAYNKHMKHKLLSRIDNRQLFHKFKQYQNQLQKDTLIEEFECLICRNVHNRKEGKLSKVHYNCYEPLSIVNNRYNRSNWWHNDYLVSKCEADLLRTFIDNGVDPKNMKFDC